VNLVETKLSGVYLLEMKPATDQRGYYQRLWGKDEFLSLGLDADLNNVGLSYNKLKGTFRGMHFQRSPFAETKLVQCLSGRIYDVILDIRADSQTFGEWISVELSPEKHNAVYIPKGLAHGFQTLEDDSKVMYAISEQYQPQYAGGIRWDDARFGIELPLEVSVINERDAGYPDFR
jgi:dTDP-4-dehydrorhamnose 3,5-epimerase